MSASSWGLLALFLATLVLLAWPLGIWLSRICDGQPAALDAQRWKHRCFAWPASRPATPCTGGSTRWRLLAFNALGVLVRLRAAAPAGRAALQSRRHGGGVARLVVQHRRQLRHQHQLAGLRGRGHHELSHADARPDGAELPVGRHRHRRGVCADPRFRGTRSTARRSATSGSTSRASPPGCCCRCRW